MYYEDDVGRYEYNLTDHLGNVRLSFTDRDGDGIVEATDDPETNEILSETHYYPFGMNMEGPWMQNAGRENPYLYNGKELNEEFGLSWLSYGAREYEPSIGRWMSVDPAAESFSSLSVYNYGLNNPARIIDPDGAFAIDGLQLLVEEREEKAWENLPTYHIAGSNSPNDWIKVNGQFVYDENVSNQDDASRLYGDEAKYVGSSHSYKAYNGRDVSLNKDGSWNYQKSELFAATMGSAATLQGYGLYTSRTSWRSS